MKVKFTLSEISELEALELRGGTGPGGTNIQCPCTQENNCTAQANCSNTQCPCTQKEGCQVIVQIEQACKGTGTGS